ncbi:MAG: T9SS type B sorting domain-containing protein [Pricia sp.]
MKSICPPSFGSTLTTLLLALLTSINLNAQDPLFANILVSDTGEANSIGSANTSRNLAIAADGTIYVAFVGTAGIRVAKSTDRGASFLPSVAVVDGSFEPEIAINDSGVLFVAWDNGSSIYLCRSTDTGATFSAPIAVGPGLGRAVHMNTFQNSIHLTDTAGSVIYANHTGGDGDFSVTDMRGYVYADIRTDQNGTVYFPSDDPTLYLFRSDDSGANYVPMTLNPPGLVFYSSYALSDGPCGTFIFVAGGGSTHNEGYKIDVADGSTTRIALGSNVGDIEGRTLFADDRGTLIDGYRNEVGDLMMNISYNQGQNFGTPIKVANGISHNIDRNPLYDDVDVVFEKEGQIYLSVYPDLLKNIKLEPQPFPVLCEGNTFDLSFQLSGDFDPGTVFSAYLSDSRGSFENKTLVGSIVSDSSDQITATVPTGVVYADTYRIMIASEENCVQSNGMQLTVGGPRIKQPLPLLGCSQNNDGINRGFDTTHIESEVLDGQTGLTVSYFDSDGNELPSPLPNPLANAVPYSDEIIIRVSEPSASCHSETVLYLEVTDAPEATALSTIYNYDYGDGLSVFNLSSVEGQLNSSGENAIITFFDHLGTEIPTPLPSDYTNRSAWSETIEVHVANPDNPLCYREIALKLVVNELPAIDLEERYSLCDLEPSLRLSSNPDFDTWNWTDENGNLISETFEAELFEAGTYRLKVGETKNGVYAENEFTFEMVRSKLPTISEIVFSQLTGDNSIEILATGDGDFEYSIDQKNYQKDNFFDGLSGGVFIATVRDKNGCGEYSEKVVLVDYPRFFTPNADGANDFWQIEGIQEFPNATVSIFDRYGKLLDQMGASEIGWDGMLQGKPLFAADYWFKVELDGITDFNGHFSLKR